MKTSGRSTNEAAAESSQLPSNHPEPVPAKTPNSTTEERYWSDVRQSIERPLHHLKSIVVTHIVSDRLEFLDAVNDFAEIVAVIPKPTSCNPDSLQVISSHYPVWEIERYEIMNSSDFLGEVSHRVGESPFVLLDIGGYFAPVLPDLSREFSEQLVGVVEDTENGHHLYRLLSESNGLPVPVISAARSPNKEPEDFQVGQAVVFSAEAILRTVGRIMTGSVALVLGFGKIGRSIAERLSDLNIHVMVHDINPSSSVFAKAQGYEVKSRTDALAAADLIFCATGKESLTSFDFELLKDGATIFSVTSSDSELVLAPRPGIVSGPFPSGEHVEKFEVQGRTIYLIHEGNAVNFIHGGVVGPYINLVQSELVASIPLLAVLRSSAAPFEISCVKDQDRKRLAEIWIEHFA